MVSWNYVEMLFAYSCIDPSEIDEIRDRLTTIDSNWNEFTESEYYKILTDLQDSQLDKISNGFSYNMTEISRHLKKLK